MQEDPEISLEIINDHYRHPRNYGKVENPALSLTEHNPVCGDTLHFTISMSGRIIENIKFIGSGCSISQASASMLTERAIGKDYEDVLKISEREWIDQMGIRLGPNREKCALLSLSAVKKMLRDYADRDR